HGLDDRVPVTIVHDFHRLTWHRRQLLYSRRLWVFDGANQSRRMHLAARSKYRRRMSELQGGRQHVSLAYASDDRFAPIPGFIALSALPFPRREKAGPLVAEIDPGEFSESEPGQIFVHAVD